MSEDQNSPENKSNLSWAHDVARQHPFAAAVGIVIILVTLVLLVFTAGQGDNVRFVMLLITLIVIATSIFFTFSPLPPSALRAFVGIMAVLATSSICLNEPIPIRNFFDFKKSSSVKDVGKTDIDDKLTDPSERELAEIDIGKARALLPPEINPYNGYGNPPRASINPRPRKIEMITQEESVSGPSINVGCEETISTTLPVTIPLNAVLIDAHALWTDLNNVKNQQAATKLSSAGVVAEGTITGLDRQQILFGIANCPGGGHGRLNLTVRYSKPASD